MEWISPRSIWRKSGISSEVAEHQALLKFNLPLEAFVLGGSKEEEDVIWASEMSAFSTPSAENSKQIVET